MDLVIFFQSQREKYAINRRYLLTAVGVAVLYVVAAKLGLSLAYTTKQVTSVWPPTGIALVALLFLGVRYWPALLVGAFVANIITRETILVAGLIAIGNTLEAVAGVYLLRRVAGFSNAFFTIRDVIGFFLLAGAISTLVSATIGTTALAYGGIISWNNFGSVWPTWWTGDMLGDLLFAPFLIVYLSTDIRAVVRGRAVEAGLLLVAIATVSYFVFASQPTESSPLIYLPFPLLVWAAIRFTQVGVVTGTVVAAIIAIWATVNDIGPLAAHGTVEQNLIQLQLFVVVISSTSLLLAATIAERFAVESALRRKTLELEESRKTIIKDIEYKEKLEKELEERNKRITAILAGALSDRPNSPRHSPRE